MYEIGKLVHIVEHQRGVQRLDLGPQPARRDVAAAKKGEDAHAGALRGDDAGGAVLDDDAIGRRCPHRRGGMEEEVGRGLAVGYHGGRIDRRVEAVDEAGEGQAEADPFHLARRGDADGQVDLRQRVDQPRHRPQFAAEQGVEVAPHPFERRVVEVKPVFGVEGGDHRGKAAPEELAEAGIRVDVEALGGDGFEQHPHGERLAVDQNAVAVEDDEADIHRGWSQLIQLPPSTLSV